MSSARAPASADALLRPRTELALASLKTASARASNTTEPRRCIVLALTIRDRRWIRCQVCRIQAAHQIHSEDVMALSKHRTAWVSGLLLQLCRPHVRHAHGPDRLHALSF